MVFSHFKGFVRPTSRGYLSTIAPKAKLLWMEGWFLGLIELFFQKLNNNSKIL